MTKQTKKLLAEIRDWVEEHPVVSIVLALATSPMGVVLLLLLWWTELEEERD